MEIEVQVEWLDHHTWSFKIIMPPLSLLLRAAPSSTSATRSANFSVLIVSPNDSTSGLMCTNIKVFACPPAEIETAEALRLLFGDLMRSQRGGEGLNGFPLGKWGGIKDRVTFHVLR